MRSQLVLCTRNRPDDVRRLFASLLDGNADVPVLVVDASTDERTRRIAESASGLQVRYLRSEPGLTRQRMLGVNALEPDVEVVHFLDDDVVLEPGYFEALERVFAGGPETLGAGGLMTNLPDRRLLASRRFFLLDSARGGRVLRSGTNILPFGVDADDPVTWLSGCSMSFRRAVFESLSFDTRMEGYSLGEDVDFTYRVSLLGSLKFVPDARYAHLCSPTNRYERHDLGRMEIVHRYTWVSEMRGHGVTLYAFWWSVAGDIVFSAARGVLRARRDPLRRVLALVRGVSDIWRLGPIAPNARLANGGPYA